MTLNYGNGWIWLQADTGATLGPFQGTLGLCSFKTDNLTPWEMFSELFDESMFTHLADETNRHARQRKTGKYVSFLYLLHFIIHVTCSQHETNSGKKKSVKNSFTFSSI